MFTVGFKCNFRKITARFSAGRRQHLVVSYMLLFWCSWFKYRLIKRDLVTVGKFCFNFSRVLDGVVDCVSVRPSAMRDAQNTCALTKVGTVLNKKTILLLIFNFVIVIANFFDFFLAKL